MEIQKDNYAKELLQSTPLRISTKTVTANFSTTIQLKHLFENVHQVLIPLWYPGEGILKMEFESMVIGSCIRDEFSKRQVSDKTFNNQSTIVVRKATDLQKTQFKEVNCKIFTNGGVQMTGIPNEEFGASVLEWLLKELLTIKPVGEHFFQKPASISKFRVELINSDFKVAHPIKRDVIHNILTRKYGLFSTFEGTIYQGVNTKYYYNEESSRPDKPGICFCTKKCKGKGDGCGNGECKRITISIFQTGKIIITGARFLKQLEEAYNFLNAVMETHVDEVLRLPDINEHQIPVKPKQRRAPRKKKGLLKVA